MQPSLLAAVASRRRRSRWARGASVYDPLSLTGLDRWYDASDLSTLWQDAARTTPVASDSDPVGAWDDKSGNAEHAVAAADFPAYKTGAIGGLPGVLFNGNDNLDWTTPIESLGTADTSIVAVVKVTVGADQGFVGHSTNGQYYWVRSGGTIAHVNPNAGVAPSGAVATGYRIIEIYHASTGGILCYIDGADSTDGSPSSTSTSPAKRIGNRQGSPGNKAWNGHFGEFFLSDSADWNALGEREALYTYLTGKWGTP